MKDYKSIYTDRIAALLPNVSMSDKIFAMESVNISRPTLDKYLKGQIIKQDVAIKIIRVLTGRITERYNTLKEIQIN